MKKIAMLTSLLALTACGGGSVGGNRGDSLIEPIRVAAKYTITQDRASVTRVDYVLRNIPNAYDNATDDEKAEIAKNLLDVMHKTISDLISLQENENRDDGLNSYIAEHKTAVKNALLLYAPDIDDDMMQQEREQMLTVADSDIESYMSSYVKMFIWNQNTQLQDLDYFEKTHGFIEGEITPDYMVYDNKYKMHFDDEGKLVSIEDGTSVKILSDDGTYSDDIDLIVGSQYQPRFVTDVKGYVELFGAQLGLKYSDFGYDIYTGKGSGYTSTDAILPYADTRTFIGGYIPKETQRPDNGAKFVGAAVAPVKAQITDKTTNQTSYYTMVSVANGATLELNNNQEILTANFSGDENNPWYDVVVTRNLDNDSIVATLSGDGANITDELYKIQPDAQTKVESYAVGYYGDDDVASEAVLRADVIGDGVLNSNDTVHRVRADVVFGGKK